MKGSLNMVECIVQERQLTSVDVIVEGRERGVGRAPAGRLGVHHEAAPLARHGTTSACVCAGLRARTEPAHPRAAPRRPIANTTRHAKPTVPRGPLRPRVLHFRTVREPRRDTSLIATRPLQPEPDLLSLGRYHLDVDGKPKRNRPGFRTLETS
ncbi:unnamed protein product [Arctia plantaginis]|uniref:Uncharacterized protein n=1 Tax=Arctia plantaginis TaxID=874455 RepID=A0A8S1A9N7_ARCPL|nr:unnamed protein product [Arctia plantaginis]